MPALVDLVGQRFGRLVVERKGESVKLHTRWHCRCDCGGEKLVRACDLRKGRTASCGCLRRESSSRVFKELGRIHGAVNGRKARVVTRRYQAGTMNREYASHCGHARTRGWEPLPRVVWQSIVLRPCHYCGGRDQRLSTYARRVGNVEDTVLMCGVDRLRSSLGYVDGNCVPCCGQCNRAKLDTDHDDFIAWVRRVATHTQDPESIGGS